MELIRGKECGIGKKLSHLARVGVCLAVNLTGR